MIDKYNYHTLVVLCKYISSTFVVLSTYEEFEGWQWLWNVSCKVKNSSEIQWLYNALSEDLVRDRLVCGINYDNLRKKLLQEPTLTLQRSIYMCRAHLATQSQLHSMKTDQVSRVSHVKPRSSFRQGNPSNTSTSTTRPTTKRECSLCGGVHEMRKDKCPAFGKVCTKCGTPNHFAAKSV